MKKIISTMLSLALISAAAITVSACSEDGNYVATDANPDQIKLLDESAFTTEFTNDDGKAKETGLWTIKSTSTTNPITMQITNYGARIVSFWVADKNANYQDVALGHKSIDEYINYEGERCLGCTVGRYANRIDNGAFTLEGVVYDGLDKNNNGNTLHGGDKTSWAMNVWDVQNVSENSITFKYTSADMEGGFPGNVVATVTYELTENNSLDITYLASTDKDTVINLTNHTFWNLKGEGNGTILDEELQINADNYTPTDDESIPSGEIASAKGTPFDFLKPTTIGKRIEEDNEQLRFGKGYDHNWVINGFDQNDGWKMIANASSEPGNASLGLLDAVLYDPSSGIEMKVYSDQPGLQFYSGNFLDGKVSGKWGAMHKFREGLALETQNFPDAPNHANFPNSVLKSGETYNQSASYQFSVR